MVSRVAAVLGAFSASDRTLGVSELARRTGLPKSTVHRLTGELLEHRFLERDGTALRLGLRLFELGENVPRQRHLRDVALPHMADLRAATGQTVHLAVLDGTDVVYVQIVRSENSPKMPSRIGGRLPAHATGVGKALLAFAPPESLEAVLARGLRPMGPRTVTSPAILRRQLGRIRETGVAHDHEESGPGTVCAASPVLDDTGLAHAAISVSGWSGKLNVNRIAPAVHTTALALARTLH
ncbi:IclR family transcriptional regulator [Saccharopolyspora rosea]|uniref:IclR family transcriptional regulator n=1 Tax=Saccharopolyspora rosea TaxID=524884 RepID=A0ABW3FSB6_9PSEU|nr:IclR family transcriptional regulator [Saccharopolyspora rosea]